MVQTICHNQTVEIPEGVTVEVKSRYVTVKGKRGTLERDFKHLWVDIAKVKTKSGGDGIKVEKFFGTKKELAAVRTVCSHISNMIVGVTNGYEYKMKFVYAHFPINVNCEKVDGSKTKNLIEIRNYLGEKVTRKVYMQPGCEVDRTKEKDEICIIGNSREAVGTSVSQIQQICQVKHKDIRKYLDGIYATSKKVIE
mmetsp:Transcript_2793/g.5648  ORF Transcript_2793/g.5648 Transcript_2793/m.5648 type:complete len:196 (-) Transcript_2793:84-671(-)|eukprot:CAMPEP_0181316082 /NCGR_PEP_ID=MMETSP1101-20121128/15707_1 /TAXON_ID=46948 /ORGANISM="Rhodomonas abbreviata, Strain Caron Lab Isolate" /LENGTH=195 /DNA_ID=CAMNT_0023423309 /DNA_START=26 /DNA_END=613 /DNA_ORIENTATION=-